METTKKSTFKVLFYLKKNAPKKSGKVTVMCRITVNGKGENYEEEQFASQMKKKKKKGRRL